MRGLRWTGGRANAEEIGGATGERRRDGPDGGASAEAAAAAHAGCFRSRQNCFLVSVPH